MTPGSRGIPGRWPVVGGLLVAVGLLAGGVAPAAAAGAIRVAIVESARAVELRGTAIEVAPGPDAGRRCERCPAHPWWASVIRAAVRGADVEIDGRRSPVFRLRSAHPIRVHGREYPALIELVRHGDGLAVVNELPLEHYLVGVVRAEIWEDWPLEALRAQAIAARTYAAYQRTIGLSRPFDILASTAHQLYAGRVPPASPAWEAVRSTAGQVLLWEGELFPAFYHTESGGHTEDPRAVFAAPNMPALRAVRCPFSTGSPHARWALEVRLADLAGALERHGVGVGAVARIEVAERTPSLRASVVAVHGTRTSVRLRGNDFRQIVGYDTLKSTLFSVLVEDGVARFAGRGYGHGVGMCQWGAKGMAVQGFTAHQILEFYYPGATPGRL